MISEQIEQLQRLSNEHVMVVNSCPAIIMVDRERLTQVLTNLISNAIKYSPKGGNITIVCEELGGELQVSVRDEGIGIEKKLFDRFFRIQAVQSKTDPGMGLGLYITAEIIHRHKGRIWLESELGMGSTFYFALPLYREAETIA